MTLKTEDYLERAAEAEALAKRASNPAIRDSFLELAKALREMAGLLTRPLTLSDAEVEQLAERMTAKTKRPGITRGQLG